jgi:DNA-binding transcriptional MerR regulator
VLVWLVVDLGLNDMAIARLCKVSSKTVRSWRRQDGIVPPAKTPVTREVVVDLYVTRRLSMEVAGRKLGRSRSAFRRLLDRYGIQPRKPGRPRRGDR